MCLITTWDGSPAPCIPTFVKWHPTLVCTQWKADLPAPFLNLLELCRSVYTVGKETFFVLLELCTALKRANSNWTVHSSELSRLIWTPSSFHGPSDGYFEAELDVLHSLNSYFEVWSPPPTQDPDPDPGTSCHRPPSMGVQVHHFLFISHAAFLQHSSLMRVWFSRWFL